MADPLIDPLFQCRQVDSPDVSSFLKLPLELRFVIYNFCLDIFYATSLVNANIRPPHEYSRGRVPFDWLTTPSILLVNRQITDEALYILYGQPLVLSRGCTPHIMMGCFSKPLLQRLRFVTINVDLALDAQQGRALLGVAFAGGWSEVLRLLGLVWDYHHNLQQLEIKFKSDSQTAVSMAALGRSTCHQIYHLLMALHGVCRIPNVIITRTHSPAPLTMAETAETSRVMRTFANHLQRQNRGAIFVMDPTRYHLRRLRYDILCMDFYRWWLVAERSCPPFYSLEKKTIYYRTAFRELIPVL